MSLFAAIRSSMIGLVSVLALSVALPAIAQKSGEPEKPAKSVVQRDPNAVPRGVIITMGDRDEKNMVGVYMTAEQLRRMVPMLEEDKVDIVVLRFYSGGGYGSEVMKMSDVLLKEYRQKFHTIAWIESAISAAAMTAHSIPDIYFTSQANYGACTGFYGSLDRPVTGVELERALHEMEIISERGNYDPSIMRAMQISSDDADIADLKIAPPSGALSANIDEKTGDVTWYQDTTSGKYVLNPTAGRRILTFNSQTAAEFKFSKGTADTLDDLTKLLGYKEIEWVGQKVPAILWPVCKAEKKNIEFRNNTKRDEDMAISYYRQYAMNVAAAQGAATREERLKFLNKAKQGLQKLEDMLRNNPNMAQSVLQRDLEEARKWLDEQKKIIKDLSK